MVAWRRGPKGVIIGRRAARAPLDADRGQRAAPDRGSDRPPGPGGRRLLADRGFDADFAVHAEATGGAWPGSEQAEAAVEIALGFEQLEELDIVVRDLERGLIDFPAVIDGREVYLCWLLDEPSVTHWHAIEAGFAGRRPL
jgi:hypothetical protein